MRTHRLKQLLTLTANLLSLVALSGGPALAAGPGGGTAVPKVSLTAPNNNAKAAAPGTFDLAATVTSTEQISSVEFFANGVAVGADETYPYTGTFTSSTPGVYSIYAIAYAVNDVSGKSSARTVTITNAMPSITLTSPSAGTTSPAPGTLTLSANASDPDGRITSVDFRSNGNVVCRDVSQPFKCIYSAVGPGSYAISAVAMDNIGGSATSSTATVAVTGSVPGRVSETRLYSYDTYQRLCKDFNPESGAKTYGYDSAGNVVQTIVSAFNNPAGCSVDAWDSPIVDRTYDALNRLTRTASRTWGEPHTDIRQDYFPDGALKSMSSRNPGEAWVTTSYSYNLRGLLESETSTNGAAQNGLRYGYSADGVQSWLGYPDGQIIHSFPDGLGRSQKLASAAGVVYADNVSYWPGGAIKSFTYGNGLTHRMDQNARQLPGRSYDFGASVIVLDDAYDYDLNGNVVDITDAAQAGLTTRGMGYDGLDRLTAAISPAQWGMAVYSYDALDNITRADVGSRQYRYSYNPTTWRLDAVRSPAGATLLSMQYDSGGNQLRKNNQAYTYDWTNRLTAVVGLQSYRYDGLGRRVQTTDSDGKSTFWIYSKAGQVLFTSEARRSQNLAYIYLGNTQVATRSVAWGSGSIGVRYQHTDALGSPVAETDSMGAIIKRNGFEPYGAAWGGAQTDGAGYTGHVMDRDTGLIYMQQRYYDPQIGRFLSVDPMASDVNNAWNFNRYNYAANNPYKFKDPDGRVIDILVDVGLIVYDVVQIARTGATATNVAALGADVVGAVVPGVTGLGPGVRAAAHGADAAKVTAKELRASSRGDYAASRTSALADNGGKCNYCSTADSTQGDHVKSLKSFAGDVNAGTTTKADAVRQAHSPENVVGACASCNGAGQKGARELSATPGAGKWVPPNPSDQIIERL